MTARTASEKTYDLLVIGRGTSAAAYLNSLRGYHGGSLQSELPPVSILVIGKADPWSGARGYEKGHYTENINQAKQLVDHGTAQRASMSREPVDRQDWARQNETLIEEITQGHVVDAEVTNVAQNNRGPGDRAYLITAEGIQYRARKVLIATGAGIESTDREYHHVPDEIEKFRKTSYTQNKRVMDLDQFQKGENGSRVGIGKAVGVIGPAAGTDAIMEAATRGYAKGKVFWFIAGKTEPGVKLTWDVRSRGITPTFTAEEAGKDYKEGAPDTGCVVRYSNMEISVGGARAVRVTLNDGRIFEMDYLVYAVGQRGGGITRAEPKPGGRPQQVPFIDGDIKLEPIYDVNQRFSELGAAGSGGAWQHVVGLQVEGADEEHGIILVGSAAAQAARGVTHVYLDREYETLVDRVVNLSQEFRNVADEKFPELLKRCKFADIATKTTFLARDDAYYEERKKAYLTALTTKINTGINSLIGSHTKREISIRTTHRDNCRALADELAHTFILRIKAARYYQGLGANDSKPDQLLSAGLKRSLPATVADNRLIGGLQRNIGAVTQQVNVRHIRTAQGVNFLEDQETLALYIAVHYPNIPAPTANKFVQEIIKSRMGDLRGFTTTDMGVWDGRLQSEEDKNTKGVRYAYQTYFPI